MAKRLNSDDLPELHRLYVTGQLSNRALAEQFGVTEAAIRKHAKSRGWERDVSQVVRAKARTIDLNRQAAAHLGQKRPDPDAVVEAGALIQADVIGRHKTDLNRAIQHVQTLLAEMEEMASGAAKFNENFELLMEAAQVIGGEDQAAGFASALRNIAQALSAPERIKAVKSLVDAMTRLIEAERVAHDLNDPEKQGDPLEAHLARLREAASAS